jgi:ABC-type Fe3+ transport system permease subunit
MQIGSIFYKAALSTVPSYFSTIYTKIDGRQSNWAFSLGSLFLGFCILFFVLSYEAFKPNQGVKDGKPVAKPESNYPILLIIACLFFIASIFYFVRGYFGRV